MKITQKEFTNALTTHNTIFAGTTHTFDLDYIRATIHDSIEKNHHDNVIMCKRSCKARAHYLEFSGGSRLYLDGRIFYKLDCGSCTVYICRENRIDDFDYSGYNLLMVYIIEGEEQYADVV